MDDLFEQLMESERDKAINGFYTHFIVFLAVIAGLALVNLISGDSFWIQWVVLGWGLGIAFHAYRIFVKKPQEEHKIRELRRAREKRKAAAAAEAAPAAASSDEAGKPL
ncbi:2TM domain-containing protein [Hyphomicrobium sp.]|uniref:2TM domain-containing protein n=1 Tax=Hyphomicrobium sp. TaxID=82 RepID=UPI002E346540|nr:2TM domain-containing protein [Hyphomicrobium sp.]HEX2840202.1 2TM domain-containing protein [Hyphomicrobium sp.]